ncbi:MAG TPA: hypothetical protein VFN18_08390 [Solirubrobacterales bacterium]|nr:hypothetical protein [Solirubrobacterales bacterium]
MNLTSIIPPDAREFRRSRYLGDPIDLVEWNGNWFEKVPDAAIIAAPGVRSTTVKELVGGRIRKTSRYGVWVEIDRDVAHSDEDLLRWCRRHCNSELPSGTIRLSPKTWEEHSGDPLPMPFVPEFDHPSRTVRELAEAERHRRHAELRLRTARLKRDRLLREVSQEGHSRRELADVLGISFARVQQLVKGR